MVARAPVAVRVRMYNVGFGDCILLTVEYPEALAAAGRNAGRRERHVLIDFGSTSRARSRLTLRRVADYVARDTGGRLDAVVVSHRHRDHLSGFGSRATARVIGALDPRLVIRSWTEDPTLAPDSGRPDNGDGAAAAEASPDIALLSALRSGEELARAVVDRSSRMRRGGQTELVSLAEDELSNADAVAELDRLSADGRGEYLFAGKPTRLRRLLPGVKIEVLGPPKPSDWPDVARQAADSKEYWLTARPAARRLFGPAGRQRPAPLGTQRWIVDRLRADEPRQILELVRWLDDALNNTSLVLLVEVGEHTLLFGGDAQIENWGWALAQAKKRPTLRDALARVDLYKVGHHGSRNGTPISLYNMWSQRDPAREIVSLMSTKHGVHGTGERIVPRAPLVAALRSRGQLHSTEDTDADWIEARAAMPDGPWEVSTAPVTPTPSDG